MEIEYAQTGIRMSGLNSSRSDRKIEFTTRSGTEVIRFKNPISLPSGITYDKESGEFTISGPSAFLVNLSVVVENHFVSKDLKDTGMIVWLAIDKDQRLLRLSTPSYSLWSANCRPDGINPYHTIGLPPQLLEAGNDPCSLLTCSVEDVVTVNVGEISKLTVRLVYSAQTDQNNPTNDSGHCSLSFASMFIHKFGE